MIEIRHVEATDEAFWFTLDQHLPLSEFKRKVNEKSGYVILIDHKPIGILRYNLFWDEIPFCNLLMITKDFQNKGYGTALMQHFEEEMREKGYEFVMTSSRSDEHAQHFYRQLGYHDCGSIIFQHLHQQPTELLFMKALQAS